MHDSLLNNITICKAEVTQLPLLKRFFKLNGFRAQAAKSDEIYIAKQDQTILGALRLCPHDNCWLLRSMCVTESYRYKGLGHHILASIADELRSKKCYCFAYPHLENFYNQSGFMPIDPAQADPVILALYQNYIMKGKKIILMQYIGH